MSDGDPRTVAATAEQLRRHPGGWTACDNPADHAPHQLTYDPWRACHGWKRDDSRTVADAELVITTGRSHSEH
jgi:hypothetical protein